MTGRFIRVLDALCVLYNRAVEAPEQTARLALSQEELRAIAPSFTRILHYAETPTLPSAAVNPSLDVPAIEARYHAGRPEVMYVDDLLTQEALMSLRRFCVESTIWKRDYENGYLGAF